MTRESLRCLPFVAALCCLLGLLLLRPAPSPAESPLVLNTDGVSPHSRPDGSGFEDRIVTEAFRRIGRAVVLSHLASSERCLKNVNDGHDDGNYVRIRGVERDYPNLVMVPEPVSRFSFTAFVRQDGPKNLTWEGLAGRRVGYANGWKLAEQRLKGRQNVSVARDEEALFALLAAGRVEVIVAGLHGGGEILRTRGYKDLRPVLPPLESRDMFLYLHKRHQALVEPLAAALRAMRADGTMARLVREGGGGREP